MFESVFDQYLLIGFAVLVVLGIKYWTVNKSYNTQLQNFVHPDLLIPDVRHKLQKVPGFDIRILLSQNLTALNQDPTKIRNIAILIALMKQDRTNLDPFINKINRSLSEIDYNSQPEYIRKYRDCILN